MGRGFSFLFDFVTSHRALDGLCRKMRVEFCTNRYSVWQETLTVGLCMIGAILADLSLPRSALILRYVCYTADFGGSVSQLFDVPSRLSTIPIHDGSPISACDIIRARSSLPRLPQLRITPYSSHLICIPNLSLIHDSRQPKHLAALADLTSAHPRKSTSST